MLNSRVGENNRMGPNHTVGARLAHTGLTIIAYLFYFHTFISVRNYKNKSKTLAWLCNHLDQISFTFDQALSSNC